MHEKLITLSLREYTELVLNKTIVKLNVVGDILRALEENKIENKEDLVKVLKAQKTIYEYETKNVGDI